MKVNRTVHVPRGVHAGHRTRSRLSLFVVMFMAAAMLFTGCGGGSDGSLTGGGASQPIGVAIDGGLQSAPANVINAATASMVTVSVTMPANSTGNELVTAVLTDGLNSAQGQAQAQAGGGVINVGPIDATGLADGPIEVLTRLTVGDQVTETSFGAFITKDTIAPAQPTSLAIAAGASNPAGVVNAASQQSVNLTVGLASAAESSELVSLLISDGTNSIPTAAQNAIPGGTLTFSGINLSS
ncbi:MAG: hypothetical protein KDB53_05270, partial [Planctomycetes bacterium]|nr:hypothetical protein [Planctomycetota bacterium]